MFNMVESDDLTVLVLVFLSPGVLKYVHQI